MDHAVPDFYPGEPVSVRLMNTRWADRRGQHDALGTVAQLRAWLGLVGLSQGGRLTSTDLGEFRELRDALRRIAATATTDDRERAVPEAPSLDDALRVVNRHIAWRSPRLAHADGTAFALHWGGADGVARVLGDIAMDLAVLVGEPAAELRACGGPGCVLYFVRNHPRREWCSAACGNRARVARHYRRHRTTPP